MNYLKIIKARNYVFEEVANAFLKEIDEKGHRVFNTKYHYGLNETVGFFHCDDKPRKI